MLKNKGIKNYMLIQGDIRFLPIKNNCIDVIYGGGVIEHFSDTQSCVGELYRVLKKGGVSINTVPYLNLGSLTYRQLWGNIPNVPLLKQIAEFIHINILRGSHMVFGYEMSFTKSFLLSIHKKVGFRKTTLDHFDVRSSFDFIPKNIRPICNYLAKHVEMFWPMLKVVGIK